MDQQKNNGLYRREYEHDACGVGMVANLSGEADHGIVEKGMTKQEVELAFGPPCAFRTTSPALDTWCFWTEFLVGKRIIFTRGVVSEILVL